ncbi:TPA: hypothetical protein JLK88_001742 [Escherichia coli]|nr:hypothetical protein [Escherichia coli]
MDDKYLTTAQQEADVTQLELPRDQRIAQALKTVLGNLNNMDEETLIHLQNSITKTLEGKRQASADNAAADHALNVHCQQNIPDFRDYF